MCEGDWSGDFWKTVPGADPRAVCAKCGVHWNNHPHEEPHNCYTVTSPAGAWIKSHSGGPAGWAKYEAIEQAKSRERNGLGKHTVEVRAWMPNETRYSREYVVLTV